MFHLLSARPEVRGMDRAAARRWTEAFGATAFVAAAATTLAGCGYLIPAGVGAVVGSRSGGGGGGVLVLIDKDADLVLARGPFDPGDTTEGRAAAFPAAQFRLTATRETTIHGLVLTASGSGDDAAIPRVRLHRDQNGDGLLAPDDPQLGQTTTFSGDDGEARFSDLGLALAAGASADLLVVIETPAGASDNQTFRVELARAEAVDATTTVSGEQRKVGVFGAPLRSGTKTISPVGTLDLLPGPNPPASATAFANGADLAVVQLELRTSTAESLRVDRLTLRTSGSGDDAVDVQADLYLDVDSDGRLDPGLDRLLQAGPAATTDDGELTFAALSQTLQAGTVVRWLLVYRLQGTAAEGATFRAQLADPLKDLAILGLGSGQVIAARGAPVTQGATITVQRAQLTLATGAAQVARQASPGTPGIGVLQVALTAGAAEPVIVRSLGLRASGSGHDRDELAGVRLVVDVDGNGAHAPGEPILAGPTGFAQDDGTLVLTGFTRELAAGASEQWLLVYDLSGTASGGDQFVAAVTSASDLSASGKTSGLPVVATGSPASGQLTVTGSLALAAGPAPPPAQSPFANAADLPLLQVRFSAGAGETVRVTSLTLRPSGSASDQAAVGTVDVFQDDGDGVVGAGDTALVTGLGFSGDDAPLLAALTLDVPAGASRTVLVRYQLSGAGLQGQTLQLSLAPGDVSAAGSSTSLPIPVAGTTVTSNPATIQRGQLTLAAGPAALPAGDVVKSKADVAVLQARLSAGPAETVRVTKVVVEAEGTADPQNHVTQVRLYRDDDADGNVDGGELQLGATAPSFDGQARAEFTISAGDLDLAPSTTRTLLLLVSFSGVANTTFTARLRASGVTASGQTSALAVAASGADVVGPTRKLVDAVPDAAQSTVVTNPTVGVQADGVAFSTITVTVKDAMGDPIPNQTVTLFATGSGNSITQPAASTDAAGVATGRITSTVAGSKTISAVVNLGSPSQVALNALPTVTFVAPGTPVVRVTQPVVWSGEKGVVADQTDVPMLSIRLTETSGLDDVSFTSLTVTGSSTGDLTQEVAVVRLWRDAAPLGERGPNDTQIGFTGYFLVGGQPRATFALAEGILRNSSLDLLVTHDMAGAAQVAAGEGYRASIASTSDLTLVFGVSNDPAVRSFDVAMNGGLRRAVTLFGAGSADALASSAGQSVVDLATGDVDGDGDADYVALVSGGELEVRKGDGAGGFGDGGAHDGGSATPSTPRRLALVDIDRDGDLDAVVAYAATISVFRNDGSGAFTSRADTAEALTSLSDLVIVDYDRDGFPDVVVSDQSTLTGGLIGRLNDRTGALSTRSTLALATVTAGATGLTTLDADQDGFVDVAARVGAAVRLCRGNGTFFAASDSDAVDDGNGGLAAADADRDGFPDVLAVTDPNLRLLTSDGAAAGLTARPASSSSSGTPTGPRDVVRGDWDGDGRPDLAIPHATSDGLVAQLGTGARNTAATPAVRAFFTAAGLGFAAGTDPDRVAAGDFDRDGDLDLVVGSTTAGAGATTIVPDDGHRGTILATYRAPRTGIDRQSWDRTPIAAAIADLNRDGDPDVAMLGGGAANRVGLWLNAGRASGWTRPGTIELDLGTDVGSALVTGDVNRDGRPDLVVATGTTDRLLLYTGDGAGGFAAPVAATCTGDADPVALALGDVDRDGDLDAVVVETLTGTLQVFRGDGTSLANAVLGDRVTTLAGPVDVVLGDIDRDGHLDAVLVAPTGLQWFQGSASGAFTAAGSVALNAGLGAPASLALGDLDRDGRLDVVVGSANQAALELFQGQAGPTFASQGLLGLPFGATGRDVLLVDGDRDGRLDVVAGGAGGLHVRRATGSFTFALTSTQSGFQLVGLATGDVNRDGDGDVVGAATSPVEFRVFVGD